MLLAVILYLIVAYLVGFVIFKKNEDIYNSYIQRWDWMDFIVEKFMPQILFSVAWVVTLPTYFLLKLLNKVAQKLWGKFGDKF